MKKLRNIAIIAHVDHGKTTLVDRLLRDSGAFRDNQQVQERAMDSQDLERERGITILAKCTSIKWHDDKTEDDIKVNIIDTPGHADFGGEVERILGMVDGVVLLVDAAEGPMPQTKFVTSKAIEANLPIIVVINKADKPEARLAKVHEETFELLVDLDASEEQIDFPLIIASAKNGWAIKHDGNDLDNLDINKVSAETKDTTSIFNTIIEHISEPAPKREHRETEPFSYLVTIIDTDPYLGRILIGRVESGSAKTNMSVKSLDLKSNVVEQGRIAKLFKFSGLQREIVEEVNTGDIIAIAGLSVATVSNTICDVEIDKPIDARPIDPPTMSITITINDSPYAGQDGKKVQSRIIQKRLLKEAESNISIKVKIEDNNDAIEVAGRGELQLGVLIETMRREGFELSISRPRVIYKYADNGQKQEPFEEVIIDVDNEHSGVVIEKLSKRKATLSEMKENSSKTRLLFHCPSRGLIGYLGEFLTDTRGTGIMNRIFLEYRNFAGEIPSRNKGVIISNSQGEAVAYALNNIEERGVLYIGAGEKIYNGMIIGENAYATDLEVNPLKSKQLTNIRAAGKDDTIRLTPPKKMSLEFAISYISDNELVEVTPNHIRLRKKLLEAHLRKKDLRDKKPIS